LRLPGAGPRELLLPASLLAATCALVGVAVAQPVLLTQTHSSVRSDAAAFVVLDTSRSMLAARSPGAPTRFERARRAAFLIRERLAGVPVGIASMSDRVLPHLFPTVNQAAFAATLTQSIGVGRPSPAFGGVNATSLTSLEAIPAQNFFAPSVRKRVAIVLTDAESEPISSAALRHAFRIQPRTELILVRIGGPGEHVWDLHGFAAPDYASNPNAPALALQAATSAGGALARTPAAAATQAERLLGPEGPTAGSSDLERRTPLAPYAVLAAAAPLALLVRRRNIG